MLDGAGRQIDVYRRIGRPVVTALLDGFNAGILAFGQTGTGKVRAFRPPVYASIVTYALYIQLGCAKAMLPAIFVSQTFTMEGPTVDDGDLRGLAPRVLEGIFQGIYEADAEERVGLLKEASSMGLLRSGGDEAEQPQVSGPLELGPPDGAELTPSIIKRLRDEGITLLERTVTMQIVEVYEDEVFDVLAGLPQLPDEVASTADRGRD